MRWMIVATLVLLTACGGSAPSRSPEDVIAKFKAAGLEAESPAKMDAHAYGAAPLVCQDGARRFLIPSLGQDKGGRLFVCGDASDATKLKTYYDELGKSSALLHSWTYQKDAVILQLNGDVPQAMADRYGAVINALP
jgi:hypothetical protein